MLRWLVSKYYKRLRQIDIDLLWPVIKEQGIQRGIPDLAKTAMLLHAKQSVPWQFIGCIEYTKIIENLK